MLNKCLLNEWISSVQSLTHVQLFVTPWTAACQASLSITNSKSLLKLMSIKSRMSSNHLIPFSSCLQSFPASGSFPVSQFFASCGQSVRPSASASVLSMNTQGWFSLELTDWISLLLSHTLLKEREVQMVDKCKKKRKTNQKGRKYKY